MPADPCPDCGARPEPEVGGGLCPNDATAIAGVPGLPERDGRAGRLKRQVAVLLACWLIACSLGAQDGYQVHLQAAERAKAKRDFSAMETALAQALRFGAGDEYAYRSLQDYTGQAERMR